MTAYAWRRLDGEGHSMARLARTSDGWVADGVEVLAGESPIACDLSVELTQGWVTRRVRVEALDADGRRRTDLVRDDDGRWSVDGEPRVDLDGALDVDVAATPLTNTFPVRRLADLPVGDAVTLVVAWVDVPSLAVTRVDQTYRRVGEREWQYADAAHGAFRLTVDVDGVVETYEGFAERV